MFRVCNAGLAQVRLGFTMQGWHKYVACLQFRVGTSMFQGWHKYVYTEQSQHVCVLVLQGKQIQHSPHALPLRQGTRRRQGMTNQTPQQQQQQQQQQYQQQQQQFPAQQSMQQQGSISRLASDNLINSNTMNMNGAALLTGLGESLFLSVVLPVMGDGGGSARWVPGILAGTVTSPRGNGQLPFHLRGSFTNQRHIGQSVLHLDVPRLFRQLSCVH